MELKMEVYSPALELLGLLEKYNAVLWERRAFSAGSFTLSAPLTEQARTLLAPENILWFEGDAAGIIEYVEQEQREEGPSITVKGRELSGILDRRILWGRYDLSGSVEASMRQLVTDCCIAPTRGDTSARVIPGLVLAAQSPGGPAARVQITGGTLLEALEKLGGTYGVAFGVRFNAAVPRMEFWARTGVNRSVHQSTEDHVFYSTELDDVLSSEYTYNSADYRNAALVAGEGEGSERVTVTVFEEGEAAPSPDAFAGFAVLGDSEAMRTADGAALHTVAITAGGEVYRSAYTGAQIDEAVRRALAGQTGGGSGTAGVPAGGGAGQILAKKSAADYDMQWVDAPSGGAGPAGVSSWHGRTGAVVPQSGDYTAAMVGAATMADVDGAIRAAVLDSWGDSY